MPCLDLCVCVHFRAIWLDPSLHTLICLDSCFSMFVCKVSTCLHVWFYACMSRFMFSHAYVLRSMSSTCFMLSSMCLCTPCHVCMPRPRPCLLVHSMPCSSIVAFLSLCLSFLCFGLLVQTRSRPHGLCYCPYTLTHIKGFRSFLLVCLCLLALMLYACVSLSCSRTWRP